MILTISAIHTPSCIWRRTGEIQKANQEFANVTGIPASMFRGGVLCVYELMDEDSAVRYWEGYAKIAFDSGELIRNPSRQRENSKARVMLTF